MNLLSIGGAYGVVVALFQWGWLQGLTGLEETVAVVPPLPVLFFAVLFGLSIDDEVFLLSRIREEYDAPATTSSRWPGGWQQRVGSSRRLRSS